MMNEFVEYLLILTIFHVYLAKSYRNNQFLFGTYLLMLLSGFVLAFNELTEEYYLFLAGMLIFNVILSIFCILNAINEKKVRK